jgi:DNA-binding CsgD family transcriptional regulator
MSIDHAALECFCFVSAETNDAVPLAARGLSGRDSAWLARFLPDPLQTLDILESVAEGIVILDERQSLLFVNEYARTVIEASGDLRIEGNRLEAAARPAQEALRSLLQLGGAGLGADRPLHIGGAAAGADVWLRLLKRVPRLGHEPAIAMVALSSSTGGIRLKGASLRRFFNMSEAEAFVAMALAQGHTASWIAEQRKVSVNTVRTQVRIVLRKAGADRIADLVRIVANLPISRDGRGD